jgi:hypothetical protein
MSFGSTGEPLGWRILVSPGLLDPGDADGGSLMKTLLRLLGTGLGLALCAGVAAEVLGRKAFSRLVRSDVQTLLVGSSRGETKIVSEEMLAGLPEPVQRYLRYTGVVGKPFVRTVQLRQKGKMLLGAGKLWIPLKAQQWYCVQPPGFVWEGTLHIGPIPIVRGRDMYRRGEGHMLIKAASLFTVADAKGKEVDHGEMMRHLSEMMWFPSAFLEDNISFEAHDATSARVTLTDHGRTATGTLLFDADGRLTEFVGRRYAGGDLETWSVPVTAYGEMEGLNLPVRGKAVWKLTKGDQEYIDVTITELHHLV